MNIGYRRVAWSLLSYSSFTKCLHYFFISFISSLHFFLFCKHRFSKTQSNIRFIAEIRRNNCTAEARGHGHGKLIAAFFPSKGKRNQIKSTFFAVLAAHCGYLPTSPSAWILVNNRIMCELLPYSNHSTVFHDFRGIFRVQNVTVACYLPFPLQIV